MFNPVSKESQLHGWRSGPKAKQPIPRTSSKPKFRCSNGVMVSQKQIENRLAKAYKFSRPLRMCECCNRNAAIEHDHTLSKQKCKENGQTELIWNEMNWSNSCRSCHVVWGNLDYRMEDHLNFVPRMLFLMAYDREEYMKRRLKVRNFQVLRQLPE